MRKLAVMVLLSVAAQAEEKKEKAPAHACPAAATAAIEKAFPGSKLGTCKTETHQGAAQTEVKLTRADGTAIEVDVSVGGEILQVEEQVAIDTIPPAVMKAFTEKYGKVKLSKAEKQTVNGKGTLFELAWEAGGKKREATFEAGGKFVEEEYAQLHLRADRDSKVALDGPRSPRQHRGGSRLFKRGNP